MQSPNASAPPSADAGRAVAKGVVLPGYERAKGVLWSESWIHGELIEMAGVDEEGKPHHQRDASTRRGPGKAALAPTTKFPNKLKKQVSMFSGKDELIE